MPCAAPSFSSFPIGKNSLSRKEDIAQGKFLLLFMFISVTEELFNALFLSQTNHFSIMKCYHYPPVWRFWNRLSVLEHVERYFLMICFCLSGSLHRRLYEYYTEVQFECAEYMELYGYEKMTFSQFISTFSFQDGRLLWFDDLLKWGSCGRAPWHDSSSKIWIPNSFIAQLFIHQFLIFSNKQLINAISEDDNRSFTSSLDGPRIGTKVMRLARRT